MEVRKISRVRKAMYSTIAVLAILGLAEGVLRLVGFEASSRLERMEFTFPIDEYNASAPIPFLERDSRLFWKPRPGVMGHNSRGFAGPEFSESKKAGVVRIVCLGDSCTHFGPDSYPDMLASLLRAEGAGMFEVINAGVIGYSSHQGATLMEDQVAKWSPDIVTVYFGWNDHWLARGLEDKHQSGQIPALLASHNMLDGSRIYQLVHLGVSTLRSTGGSAKRVELSDYERNLRRIRAVAQSAGARTWFLTAPHALDLKIPPFLLQSGEVSDPAKLVGLHCNYNQVVRRVAQSVDAPLIDLAKEMDGMAQAELFEEDSIHLSRAGRRYVASRLYECLHEQGLLSGPSSGE